MKRYAWGPQGMLVPILQKYGEYVLYSDYSALQAENERLMLEKRNKDQCISNLKAQLHSAEQRIREQDAELKRLREAYYAPDSYMWKQEQRIAVLTELLKLARPWVEASATMTYNGPSRATRVLNQIDAALSHGEQPCPQTCNHPAPCFKCSRIMGTASTEAPKGEPDGKL